MQLLPEGAVLSNPMCSMGCEGPVRKPDVPEARALKIKRNYPL